MSADDFASKDPGVQWGELVFAGTRVPVARIVNGLKHDHSLEAVLADYPSVERAQVEAFLDHALASLEKEVSEDDPAGRKTADAPSA
jgi:uncharacterized protein (DUF433 family)